MIAILLATYNSEPFLEEQINSILLQTYRDWHLYIRDDGSTDGTLDIIKNFQVRWPDKIFVLDNMQVVHNAYGNFVELLNNVDADYYMFCDHDDVWIPNKIEICMAHMESIEIENPEVPIVIHTDMKVVDQDLNVISESFWQYSRILPDHCSFWELVCCNCVNGCTMLFNDKAKKTIQGHEAYCLMHDTLVAQSVAAVGGIIFAIRKPTVLYRQHIENVIGATDVNLDYFVHRMRSLWAAIGANYYVWKRARHIKNGSFVFFLWTKMKITTLRFFK